LAALHVLISCLPMLRGCNLTFHMDNINAVAICVKGSPKPRLQAYAKLISQICTDNEICLKPVWIPRDLNQVADLISKEVDFHDYSVKKLFFEAVCADVGCVPDVDLFADNVNCKVNFFFSQTVCPGTMGVDAFSYDWSEYGLCWIFVQPKLILRVLNYLKCCRAKALVLVPQWKTSFFYPELIKLKSTQWCKKVLVYSGVNVFVQGSDPTSYFGPCYNGNIEVWCIDYTINCAGTSSWSLA